MRLLEFETADCVTQPQAATLTQKPAKKPVNKTNARAQGDAAAHVSGKDFRAGARHAIQQPVRRPPIDIEQLQQRIEVLEHRMRVRAHAQGNQLPAKDLEALKQRMKLLERSVHTELWAAKQREHTLLEMLARPPLKQLIRDRVKRLHTHTLPATRQWCRTVGRDWWQTNQPLWWPEFSRAWLESLDTVPPKRTKSRVKGPAVTEIGRLTRSHSMDTRS